MLVEADDAVFAALEAGHAPARLRLADAGWEAPVILAMLRTLVGRVREHFHPAAWLIVEAGEVVGMCSLKNTPDAAGGVEIGYGVAPSRRGRGIAGRAIAELLRWACREPSVSQVTAETSVDNMPSQRVLEKNGFARVGTRLDPEDGELLCWEVSVDHPVFAVSLQ